MALMAHEICLTAAGWTNDPSGAEISWLMPNLGGPCGHGCHLPTGGITVSHVSCLTTLEPVFPDVCLSNRICYHLPAYDNFDIFWRGNDEHPDFEVPNFQFKAIAAIASTAPGWFTGLTERQQNLGAILIGSLVGSLVRWFVSWLRRFQTFHIFPSLFRVDDSTECFFWVGHTADPQDAEHLVGTGARKDEGLWMTGYLGMLWAWPWTLSLDVHEM